MILGVAFSFVPQKAEALSIVCKSERIDCPGWGTGDRVICHQNGDGVPCQCGTSTKCPDKKVQ